MQYFKLCPLPCRGALQQFADCSSLTVLCHDDRRKPLFIFYVVWITLAGMAEDKNMEGEWIT